MPVTTDITALSTTAASNSPAGTEDRTTADDYMRQIHAFVATLRDAKAAIASPTFTGTPAAPTASADTNTTQIATTAFVMGQGYLKASGGTMTGALSLPSNGLTVGTNELKVSSGNVGIGTASPEAKLHVQGSDDTYVYVKSDGAGDYSLSLGSGGLPLIARGSGASLAFGTVTNNTVISGWTEQMRIDASGNVGIGTTSPSTTLHVNGAVTTNGQIVFPATQNASSNANTLDDYEEGTWTPTVSAASGSITSYTSSGKYTKVGNKVSASIEITITTKGTASNLMQVSLPFTASGSHAGVGVEVSPPAGFGLVGWVTSGTSTFSCMKASGDSILEGDGDQFILSITYLT